VCHPHFNACKKANEWESVMARNVICTALACTVAVCALAGPARKHGLGGIRFYPQPRYPVIALVVD
jgi:hypothetical protein